MKKEIILWLSLTGMTLIFSGCCKQLEEKLKDFEVAYEKQPSPSCGPVTGGTQVTILYPPDDGYSGFPSTGSDPRIRYLYNYEVVSITITANSSTVTVTDWEKSSTSGEIVTLTTPACPGPISSKALEIPATITVTFKITCTCDRKWPFKDKTETKTQAINVDFTYINMPVPVVTDAYPPTLPEREYINTFPYDGNCGGGYSVEIWGENFKMYGDDKPMVEWNGDPLLASDVTYVSETKLKVKVPAGKKGTWVDVQVINPPFDCSDELMWTCTTCGKFYYRQEDCIPYPDDLDISTAYCAKGPTYVATGDVINDGGGAKDVITASYGATSKGGRVQIYEGDGKGGLKRYEAGDNLRLYVSGHPSAIAAGNFDGNAFTDVAITLENTNQVVVFLNSGKGFDLSAEHRRYYNTGDSPIDIEAADIDGDGNSDLVVAYSGGGGGLTLLKGNGSGNFDLTSFSTIGTSVALNPIAIDKGNFDGIGGDDIVVALSDNKVLLFLSSDPGATPSSPLTAGDYINTPEGSLIIDIKAGFYYRKSTSDVAVVCVNTDTKTKVTTNNIILLEYNSPANAFVDGYHSLALLGKYIPAILATGDYNDSKEGDFAVAYKNGEIEVLSMDGPNLKCGSGCQKLYDGLKTVPVSDMVSDKIKSDDLGYGEDLIIGLEDLILILVKNKGGGF